MPGYAAPDATIHRADVSEADRVVAAQDLIRTAWAEHGPRFAIVSSFGADSTVLLHLAARVDPNIPVLTLDTEKLFPATHRYRETLTAHLGLTDVRLLKPDAVAIATRDPVGLLFDQDPDACCTIRKVDPASPPGPMAAAAIRPIRGGEFRPSIRKTGASNSRRSLIGRPRRSKPIA
jgi:3'-phosphoadenosine 5'-phosphosulfate sulfotransferase (PAPS reductase)/FAD synthetase